jgi:hypothetical protein
MRKTIFKTVVPLLFVALFCLTVVSRSANAQIAIPGEGIINTVAGDGAGGYTGNGGAATSAELYGPSGVAVDSAGNIYIADYFNNRIRKVTASTGDISTVAGDGTGGYSGDGGEATSAELDNPFAVALDSAGNIYIGDSDNNRIRKVTVSTGIISTVAGDGAAGYSGNGGKATSAELNAPGGVAVDSAGNIYIADVLNNRIRKVTVSTGDISTVAGDGTRGYSGDGGAATSAELFWPSGVTLDSAGNIYIADADNMRVRVVNTGTAQITIATVVIPAGDIATVAGDGTGGYSGDGGVAISAKIDDPAGVAVDGAGNIYIADRDNYRIREVTASTGFISTVAGDGTPGYSGDGGNATSAELSYADGVAVDSYGNIYIADSSNQRIRAVGVAPSGFVNPKYIVVGVTYAPPGPSSFVQYTGTTSVGNTTTINSSFSNDVGFSVSVKAGISGWGVGGGVTGTSSTDYTQGSSSSTTTTISKLTSLAYKTAGTGNAFSPVDSDYDTIWLWLNPVVLLSYTPATSKTVAGIVWNGYGYDTNDPSGKDQPDVYPVQVGWLNGHFGNSPSIDTILARGWVTTYEPTMIWAAGTGPGLTTTDITNIIAADPLTNSGYTELNSFPSTTTDGRFTIEQGPNNPNPIPYEQAGPGNGGGTTTMYGTTQTDTQSVATGTSSTFKQAFGLQEVFSGTPFGIGLTVTLNQTDTLIWTNSWLNTLTTTTTLQDSLSVTGPNCPAPPPGPCNPVYAGPGQFLLYQDNQYGTFLFFPAN